jgi:excisionase family DNA binding protein
MFRVFSHLVRRRYFDTRIRAGQSKAETAPYSRAPRGPITPPKSQMMMDRKTISIMKACELVGVSRRTIYNWIASGKVEYIRTAGGSVRIFVDTLWRDPDRTGELTRKEAS